mgnify:CR=1 FL=1
MSKATKSVLTDIRQNFNVTANVREVIEQAAEVVAGGNMQAFITAAVIKDAKEVLGTDYVNRLLRK